MAKETALSKLTPSVLQEFRRVTSSLEPTYTHIYVDSLFRRGILAVHSYFAPERTDTWYVFLKLVVDGVSFTSEALVVRERMPLFLDIADYSTPNITA